MKKYFLLILFIKLFLFSSKGQSIEFMPSTQNVFADIQFLKPVVPDDYTFTVFSRIRGTIDYEGGNNFLSLLYLNYTSKSGIGLSLVGKVNNVANGFSSGVHYLKNSKNTTLFIAITSEVKTNPTYSWFSVFRFRPPINEKWKWYTSLELSTLVNKNGHLASTQRIRAGVDISAFQFGLGLGLSESGKDATVQGNPGIFIRREF